jgi:hypothetical protein
MLLEPRKGTAADDKNSPGAEKEAQMQRNRGAIALVEGWMQEDPTYDLETLPLLQKALDESRESVEARPLFRDEDPSRR